MAIKHTDKELVLNPSDFNNTPQDNYNVYEYKGKTGSIQVLVHKERSNDYMLYNNNKLIFKSRLRQSYLELWKHLLRQALTNKVNRILIVGGGDQLLSNYLLRFPCDITIVDPLAYHYFQPDIKSILKIKEYVSRIDFTDQMLRKMVPINMTLEEALEDGILKEEFDIILVDNMQEDLFYSTGMYRKHIPDLYYDLLKQDGYLIINNRYGVPKHVDKKFAGYPKDIIEMAKGLRDFYNDYKMALHSKLNLIDHITKGTTTIELFKKNYKNI